VVKIYFAGDHCLVVQWSCLTLFYSSYFRDRLGPFVSVSNDLEEKFAETCLTEKWSQVSDVLTASIKLSQNFDDLNIKLFKALKIL
jgi:hypothetical protein